RDPGVAHLRERSDLERSATQNDHVVPQRVRSPAGDAQDRVFQVGAKRAERVDPLLLRTLGPLEPVLETMAPAGPCTLRQEAVEDEESVRLGRVGPLDEAVHRVTSDGAQPPRGETPLALVGARAGPVLG